MQRIPIITICHSARFHYLLDFVHSLYEDFYLVPVSDPQGNAAIWYGSQPPPGSNGLYIPASGILEEGALITNVSFSKTGSGLPILFPVEGAGLGFDLLGSIFWMMSRMEEYGHSDRDEHGRFPLAASAAGKARLHRIPVCDLWLDHLIEILKREFPGLSPTRKKNAPRSIGVDIDFAWKYRYKPWYRSAAGLSRDLLSFRWQAFWSRTATLLGKQEDPYDCYNPLIEMARGRAEIRFFILSGGKSRFDRNHPISGAAFRKLLSGQLRDQQIGIHPSYSAYLDQENLDREIRALQDASARMIATSRFHYLRLNIPESYRQLIRAGITEDYSLGYAEDLGFRAGTCHPFHWYDLEAEKPTILMLHPFQAMDRTLKDYLKLTPAEASEEIRILLDQCEKYGAGLHLIWHNSSFDPGEGWAGWEQVLEKFLSWKGKDG